MKYYWNLQRKMKGVPYKARVGSLMYAMMAKRADIAFAVSTVSQFMSKVDPQHWMVVKRIMRYLKSTLDFKLCLKGKDIVLRGFCDVDWAGDANDRWSTTGYIFFVDIGVISWKCKKQPTLALSMTEAEYMATVIVLKKRFVLGDFWRMWDIRKKDQHPSCLIIKDA